VGLSERLREIDATTAVGGHSKSKGTSIDAESQVWISRLSAEAQPSEREQAARDLHALLLRASRHTLATKRSLLPQLGREGLDELATEAADDALLAILARLDDFRGESRFTTWAWKFAFLQASVVVRRRSWLGREIPLEAEGWDRLVQEAGPHAKAEQGELLAALRRGVEEALTVHQRRVFVTLALNEVPVDVLAERLGTTRGALYKTLHDARQRLREYLTAGGLLPEGWQGAPVRNRPAENTHKTCTPTASTARDRSSTRS
jgi:RNA polymerase sigma-70 factor (ECF subfamily)